MKHAMQKGSGCDACMCRGKWDSGYVYAFVSRVYLVLDASYDYDPVRSPPPHQVQYLPNVPASPVTRDMYGIVIPFIFIIRWTYGVDGRAMSCHATEVVSHVSGPHDSLYVGTRDTTWAACGWGSSA